ncbi:MAG: T9SS C-terminal target domain-containing protein [Ignavibacteriae bacterium]|nr:MAG: T9SS C-terminal target domain-containing protein [Ignavibacteriota bacterium]
MKKTILLLIAALSISFLGLLDSPAQKYRMYNDKVIIRDDGALYIKGKINLKFKNNIALRNSTEFGVASLDNSIKSFSVTKVYQRHPLKADYGKRMIGDEDLAKIYTFFYDGNIDPTELSEIIMESNKDIIEWAEPDFVYRADYIPNDPLISQQYHIAKIYSYQAWDLCKGDTSVVIGICDSGSDLDHPDLAANIKYNYSDPINNIDDDNNGFIDDFKGWDFYYGDNDPNIMGTGNNHGSHVSGDASQVTDNAVHGGGIGFKCKLKISKHCDDSDPNGLLYSTPDGMTYLYQNGCKVINCSFGSSSGSQYVQTIIDNAWAAGVIFVASAGNEGTETLRFPAAYNHVVCVASSNSSDIKSSFSNYHDTVDIIAPGENILSTVFNNSYAVFSGTSMSSPVTAGTVALIRSKYPSWSPAQVVDRLLLGVDSIDNIAGNTNYRYKLGTGRVNAFKCVSDLPIISVLNVMHNDSLYGNNDKVYDINEKVSIRMNYKNIWLTANNVSLRLTTTDPDVEITKDSIYVGRLDAYNTYSTTYANTFEVRAKSTCPYDKSVTFKLTKSNTAYVNNETVTFTIQFRQGWATHNVNNMKLSLTKDGAIGKKSQAYGSGLFIGSGTTNQIFEGGLMIGVSNTKVSDDCRRGTAGNFSDTDFVPLNPYSLQTPGIISSQDGSGLFNDEGAGANKIGVEVKASSYAFASSEDENYIILKYRIKNTSSSNITNLYAGIYMFFLPNGMNTGNIARFDAANKIAHSYNVSTPNPYLGISVLSNNNVKFRGMLGSEVLNGFTTQEKWDALSSGVFDTITVGGLNCFVVSAGPINININDSAIVGFAVLKGNNLANLQAANINAKNKYGSIIGIQQIPAGIPEKFDLSQNYPNPFNPTTKFKISLPKNDFVSIKIYDILGRESGIILNNKMDAGVYEIEYNGENLSSGVYFYRMITGSFTDVKKMIILK